MSKIEKMLLIISVVVGVLTIVAYIDTFILETRLFVRIPGLNSFQQAYTIEYFSKEIIYVAYMFFLYKVLFLGEYKIKNILVIVIDWIAIIGCIKSGGDLLALLVLSLLMCVIYLYKRLDKNFYKTLFIFFIMVFLLLLILPQSPLSVIFFDDGDGNNGIRYGQIKYFIENINFMGYGLGATMGSGIGHKYAVEVIFINLIHKFGIFAIILIFSYIYTVYESIRLIVKSRGNPYDTIPMACMGYLMPSLGNPILFAPQHVILHCCALIIIIERKKRYKNENALSRNGVL